MLTTAIVVITAALWWPIALGVHGSALQSSAEPVVTDRGVLEPDLVSQGHLCCGDTHSYALTTEPGHYALLVIEPQDRDLVVTVFDPAGKPQRRTRCRSPGPTRVSLLSQVTGELRVALKAPEDRCQQGYRLWIEDSRPSRDADRARVEAEQAFEQAERLRWEWRKDSSLGAIREFEAALEYWAVEHAELEEARTHRAIGDVLFHLFQVDSALDHYERAHRLFRKLEASKEEASTLSSISMSQLHTGAKDRAFESATEALKLSRASSFGRGEAQALTSLGECYYYSGDNKEALRHYKEAIERFRDACDPRGEALAWVNSAFADSDSGNEAKALHGFREALSLADGIDDHRIRALALTGLGTRYAKIGKNQRALAAYSEARTLFERMGNTSWEAASIQGMGYVYDQMGLTEEALRQYRKSLSLRQLAPHPHSEAHTQMRIGQAYLKLGDGPRALEYLLAALESIRALGDPRSESVALSEIGRTYHSLNDTSKALDYLAQGLALSKKNNDKREEAHLLTYAGSIYRETGETDKALRYLSRALKLNRETANRWSESWTLYNIARAERDLGHLDGALEHAEQALAVVESLRTEVASDRLRTSYFASVHDIHEVYIDLLMTLHAQDRESGYDVTAILANEKARARSMVDHLIEARVDIRRDIEPELLEKEMLLRQRLNAKAKQQLELLDGEAKEKELNAVAESLRELTLEYDQLQASIRVNSPRYAALTQPESLSLEEIQHRVLDKGTLLLEYALGKERSYLWAIASDAYESHVLPPQAEIEVAVQQVYELMTARQPLPDESVSEHRLRVRKADSQYWEVAGRLSEMVLGPVAHLLGNQRLLVVSDGALQHLPFGALQTPKANDGPIPLIVGHEVVYMPSASTLAVLRKETQGRKTAAKAVAVLADPVFEPDDPRLGGRATAPAVEDGEPADEASGVPTLESDLHRALRDVGFVEEGKLRIPRLPFTGREAEAIVSASPESSFKAVGFQASRTTATNPELGDYRVVHFATHGLLNNEHPELSGIVLSMVNEQAKPQDGFLRLHDIYNLELPVDLVVLSACNSGLGKHFEGEGLVGIVRGFMYAGAERVVGSLWKVDDEATGELMKLFYDAMLKGGMPPSAALRHAQIEMWNQKPWRSPFYWAAFVLQGEWM